MQRKTFLTLTSCIAVAIGTFVLVAPEVMIENVKSAVPSESANVMARTVGILLITVGILDFLVRNHEDSPTLRAVLIANLVLQIGIMPIDPMAYASGVYKTLASWLPNSILHLMLAAGFVYYLSLQRHFR